MHAVLQQEEPRLWNSLPTHVQDRAIARASREAPVIVARIVREIKENIETYFDIKEMVVKAFVEEPELLNHMFIQCGYQELVFIRDCGAYMGGFFGVLQVVLWIFYSA